MDQQLKFGRVVNIDPAEIAKLEAHVDAVEKVALSLGFPLVQDKKLRRIGIAQQMPGATDMIKMMLDEEKMYRMLRASPTVIFGQSTASASLPPLRRS
jgi:hypothetical protein